MPDYMTHTPQDLGYAALKIRYKGLFDFEGLYRMIVAWYKSQRYELNEDLYKDKTDTPLGNEIEIKWTGTKEVDPLVRYTVKIYIHIWEGKEVEIIDGPIKRKLMRARMNIDFSPTVLFDYQNLFKGRKFMRPVFSRLNQRDFEFKYFGDLMMAMIKFHTKTKRFLHMEGSEGAYG